MKCSSATNCISFYKPLSEGIFGATSLLNDMFQYHTILSRFCFILLKNFQVIDFYFYFKYTLLTLNMPCNSIIQWPATVVTCESNTAAIDSMPLSLDATLLRCDES